MSALPQNQSQKVTTHTMIAASVRILYIEDTPDNQLLVKRILAAEGYQVLIANDGIQGLAMAQRERPHLILMDINMPELDGYSVTAQIKADARLAHVPVIALTANVMKGDREKVLAAGCDGYIQKPIDVDQFPQQIARYLPSTLEG